MFVWRHARFEGCCLMYEAVRLLCCNFTLPLREMHMTARQATQSTHAELHLSFARARTHTCMHAPASRRTSASTLPMHSRHTCRCAHTSNDLPTLESVWVGAECTWACCGTTRMRGVVMMQEAVLIVVLVQDVAGVQRMGRACASRRGQGPTAAGHKRATRRQPAHAAREGTAVTAARGTATCTRHATPTGAASRMGHAGASEASRVQTARSRWRPTRRGRARARRGSTATGARQATATCGTTAAGMGFAPRRERASAWRDTVGPTVLTL